MVNKFKLYNEYETIVNLCDLIKDDIEEDKKISLFEYTTLLKLLSFDESRLLNKYYHRNDFDLMYFKLCRIIKHYNKEKKNLYNYD